MLCSLARHGKALEQDGPQRATLLLGAVSVHPLYKGGGRLAFDMLEVEDLMLDDAHIGVLSMSELTEVLCAAQANVQPVADLLRGFGMVGEPEAAPPPEEMPRVHLAPPSGAQRALELPELSASDYLYDYVVLGFLEVLGAAGGR